MCTPVYYQWRQMHQRRTPVGNYLSEPGASKVTSELNLYQLSQMWRRWEGTVSFSSGADLTVARVMDLFLNPKKQLQMFKDDVRSLLYCCYSVLRVINKSNTEKSQRCKVFWLLMFLICFQRFIPGAFQNTKREVFQSIQVTGRTL